MNGLDNLGNTSLADDVARFSQQSSAILSLWVRKPVHGWGTSDLEGFSLSETVNILLKDYLFSVKPQIKFWSAHSTDAIMVYLVFLKKEKQHWFIFDRSCSDTIHTLGASQALLLLLWNIPATCSFLLSPLSLSASCSLCGPELQWPLSGCHRALDTNLPPDWSLSQRHQLPCFRSHNGFLLQIKNLGFLNCRAEPSNIFHQLCL